MTVKDIMTLLESPDRVRVIKDGEEIYNQYFANMEVDKDIVAQIGDAEVKRFRAIPEITHRKYKERGLIAPMKPEETPDYLSTASRSLPSWERGLKFQRFAVVYIPHNHDIAGR